MLAVTVEVQHVFYALEAGQRCIALVPGPCGLSMQRQTWRAIAFFGIRSFGGGTVTMPQAEAMMDSSITGPDRTALVKFITSLPEGVFASAQKNGHGLDSIHIVLYVTRKAGSGPTGVVSFRA